MHPSPPSHATHDEMLLARLYGGDVDDGEGRRALDLIASCTECANVYADLGSIALATAALPTPPRPRDFTLTQADVARIGRRSFGGAIFDWLGRTRALGGSMVAAGLVGMALVGAVSVLGQGGASSALTDGSSNAAPIGASGYGEFGAASPAVGQGGVSLNGVPASTSEMVPDTSPAPRIVAATAADSPAGPKPAASAAANPAAATGKLALTTVEPAASDNGEAAVGGTTPRAPEPGAPAGGLSGLDLALVAFAALAILGLLLLAIPRLAARRRS